MKHKTLQIKRSRWTNVEKNSIISFHIWQYLFFPNFVLQQIFKNKAFWQLPI